MYTKICEKIIKLPESTEGAPPTFLKGSLTKISYSLKTPGRGHLHLMQLK